MSDGKSTNELQDQLRQEREIALANLDTAAQTVRSLRMMLHSLCLAIPSDSEFEKDLTIAFQDAFSLQVWLDARRAEYQTAIEAAGGSVLNPLVDKTSLH